MTAAERKEYEQLLQRDRELMAFITTLQESLDSLEKQYEELSKQNQELRRVIAQVTEQLKAQTVQAAELNEKLEQRKKIVIIAQSRHPVMDTESQIPFASVLRIQIENQVGRRGIQSTA